MEGESKDYLLNLLTKGSNLVIITLLTTYAGIAQLAEQLICNQQVVGSIPIASSNCNKTPESVFRSFLVSSHLEMTAQVECLITVASSNETWLLD